MSKFIIAFAFLFTVGCYASHEPTAAAVEAPECLQGGETPEDAVVIGDVGPAAGAAVSIQADGWVEVDMPEQYGAATVTGADHIMSMCTGWSPAGAPPGTTGFNYDWDGTPARGIMLCRGSSVRWVVHVRGCSTVSVTRTEVL